MAGKTVVLGASSSPYRYSYMAAKRLLANGHDVVLIGKQKSELDGIPITPQWPDDISGAETVTMYLAKHNQAIHYDQIVNSGAKRLIFNPGSENSELEQLARKAGMEVIEACTLVMLSTNQY